jgi:4-hydroxybenzoyl-CoA reductase subunit beta
MSLPEFQLLRPRTIAEAVEHLAKHSAESMIIAGGTDLVPSMRQRLFEPKYLLDIRGISEMRGIRETRDAIEIGALTTLTQIEHSEPIRRAYPLLSQAAKTVASPLLRNMGTLGGNVCLDTRCLWYNQSLTWRKSCDFCIKKDGDLCHVAPGGTFCWAVFSGDTPPALLCLDAELEIAGARGIRRVALKDFYTNVGDARMNLGRDELVTKIILPRATANYRSAYMKLRVRGSIDYPLAAVAIALRMNGKTEDLRVGLTAVNPAPLLVPNVGEVAKGRTLDDRLASEIAEMAARTAKPLTTSALTPEYRKEMIRVFTRRALLQAASKETYGG